MSRAHHVEMVEVFGQLILLPVAVGSIGDDTVRYFFVFRCLGEQHFFSCHGRIGYAPTTSAHNSGFREGTSIPRRSAVVKP